MILQLIVSGGESKNIISNLKMEFENQKIEYEKLESNNISFEGQFKGLDTGIDILKIALAPGVLTIIASVIIKLKSTIKLKIGENSIEVSGYLSKEERKLLLTNFIKSVKLEENRKNITAFIESNNA